MSERRTNQNRQWLVMAAVLLLASTAVADTYDCVIEPRTVVELGSPAEGILVELLVNKGDRVTAGVPLARLNQEMESISEELARIKADNTSEVQSRREQLAFRRKEVERLQAMRATKAAAEREYDQAVVERRLAQLSLETAQVEQEMAKVEHRRAQEMLARREIRAPVDGVVVDVAMAPGEFAHEQSVLLSIAQLDPLYVEVYLPVSEFGTVKMNMQATVRPEEPIGGTYNAKVVVVDQVFDAASRTFGVRLELPNTDYALPAGLRCTLDFIAESPTS